jgi:hypothetical protein
VMSWLPGLHGTKPLSLLTQENFLLLINHPSIAGRIAAGLIALNNAKPSRYTPDNINLLLKDGNIQYANHIGTCIALLSEMNLYNKENIDWLDRYAGFAGDFASILFDLKWGKLNIKANLDKLFQYPEFLSDINKELCLIERGKLTQTIFDNILEKQNPKRVLTVQVCHQVTDTLGPYSQGLFGAKNNKNTDSKVEDKASYQPHALSGIVIDYLYTKLELDNASSPPKLKI